MSTDQCRVVTTAFEISSNSTINMPCLRLIHTHATVDFRKQHLSHHQMNIVGKGSLR